MISFDMRDNTMFILQKTSHTKLWLKCIPKTIFSWLFLTIQQKAYFLAFNGQPLVLQRSEHKVPIKLKVCLVFNVQSPDSTLLIYYTQICFPRDVL